MCRINVTALKDGAECDDQDVFSDFRFQNLRSLLVGYSIRRFEVTDHQVSKHEPDDRRCCNAGYGWDEKQRYCH